MCNVQRRGTQRGGERERESESAEYKYKDKGRPSAPGQMKGGRKRPPGRGARMERGRPGQQGGGGGGGKERITKEKDPRTPRKSARVETRGVERREGPCSVFSAAAQGREFQRERERERPHTQTRTHVTLPTLHSSTDHRPQRHAHTST